MKPSVGSVAVCAQDSLAACAMLAIKKRIFCYFDGFDFKPTFLSTGSSIMCLCILFIKFLIWVWNFILAFLSKVFILFSLLRFFSEMTYLL